MAPITLMREELYRRAWTTPIETLAREFGVSGRGLGKICARYGIPVPPRGYWAKKAAGKRVTRSRLPASDNVHRQEIHFHGDSEIAMSDSTKPELHPLVVYEQVSENRLTVPQDLPLTHPLVLKTQRLLNKAKRDSTGLTNVQAGALHVRISREQFDRALRVMQALMSAFEVRGFPVTSVNDVVHVTILDEPISFAIEELTKKAEHRTTFTEQKLTDRGLGWQVPKFDEVPSGNLALVITNVRHVRQRWTDGTTALEDVLNKFIVGLVRAALGTKQQRERAEQRERERQDEERKRQEEAKRLEEAERRWREEQAKVQRLERLAALRKRNQRLRGLVADLQSAVRQVAADSELGRWLQWATEHIVARRFHERERSSGVCAFAHS